VDEDNYNTHDETDQLVTSTAKYDFSDQSRLKNIFGYVSSNTSDSFDVDGTPYGIGIYAPAGYRDDRQHFSDELQWSGVTFANALNYVAGLYAAQERLSQESAFSVFDLLPLAPASPSVKSYISTDRQWAGYIQTGYNLSELTGVNGLTFNSGFRWTHDETKLQRLPGSYYPAPDQRVVTSKPSWLVGFDYQLNDELMLYVTHRGSWRTGGLNGYSPPVYATAANGGDIFLPETTQDIEVGAKWRGNLWGIPATLNLAAYSQWIQNVQRSVVVSIDGALAAVTANVPSSRITGFELDFTANLTRWLQVGGDVADTDARYTNGQVIFPASFAYSGGSFNTYADTPQWTGSVFAQLHRKLPHFGEAVLRVDEYAQSYEYFTNQGLTVTPGAKMPGYAITNVRLELNQIADTNASISVYGKNVLNKTYYTGGFGEGNVQGMNAVNVGLPRMFAVELNYKF
jgi:iron complex outermembrane receptor protein